MFDRILDLHARGKITSFLPWHSGGASYSHVEGDAAVNAIGGMEPFDIQEVHDFLTAQAAVSENSPLNELAGSLMRLPFDRCWFEFTWRPDFRQVGVAAARDRESASGHDFFLMPLSLYTVDGGVSFRLVGGDVVFRTVLDPEGRYLGTEYQSAAQERLSTGERTTAALWATVALFAVHLIHWRGNVTMQPVAPSGKALRHARNAGDRPPVTYRKVRIGKWAKRAQAVMGAGGWEQRLHKVRGHSATYTESNPMYQCPLCRKGGAGHPPDNSKSHVGNFWRPPHFAGNPEQGIILHDYEVEAPTGGQQNPPPPSGQQNPPSSGGRQNQPSGQKSFSATGGEDSN